MNTLKTMLMALALIAAPAALHAQAQTEVPAAKATDLDQKYATDLLKAGADAPDFMRGAVYGGIVGGVIGGVCGLIFAFRIFFKMQRTNDEVISQINELNA